MKKLFVSVCVLVFAMVFIGAVNADAESVKFKKGDEVYVCGCGEGCPCKTMAAKEGKCSCGKDLVKTKIDKVEKGNAYVTVNGKQLAFKTTGKYVCGCGKGCGCGMVSQKPGNCACGKPLKEVGAKK
ncbi:MAG: hypothetical protein ABFD97_11930 [Syntrophobacter sp.]